MDKVLFNTDKVLYLLLAFFFIFFGVFLANIFSGDKTVFLKEEIQSTKNEINNLDDKIRELNEVIFQQKSNILEISEKLNEFEKTLKERIIILEQKLDKNYIQNIAKKVCDNSIEIKQEELKQDIKEELNKEITPINDELAKTKKNILMIKEYIDKVKDSMQKI